MRSLRNYLYDHFGPRTYKWFIDPIRPRGGARRRGLDLCFWTCGMPRIMWLTADARYCFYWSQGNKGRSKRFFSLERQAGSNSKVYF